MAAADPFSRLARALHDRPGWVWLAGILVLCAAVAVAFWSPWAGPDGEGPPGPIPEPAGPVAAADDPRLTFATPYRNVRPEVRYVGDRRCGECHAEAVTYAKHPMGRSLAPVAAVADRQPYDRSAHDPFEKFGFVFRVDRLGAGARHAATRRTADGKDLYGVAREPEFAVGSGNNGRSFLVNLDGCLFQSPITWFPKAGRWDISPGYAATTLFDRPIKPGCLFCHCNQARPVADSINRYHTPIFHGHAIGCERCHGPAELHLRERDAGPPAASPDLTIVNPARLAPALRDAVCEQCHLQGEERVIRRGREAFDYRPGLPLHLFWSVFVRPPELAEGFKFLGHVEQMHASACFRKSNGKLGCVSCHDPHRLPEPSERVAYYRGRCQSCHEEKPCSRQAPADERELRPHRANDCIACHMPRHGNYDIPHTTVVDHRVLRRPGAAERPPAEPQPGQIPLLHFHKDLEGAGGPEVGRDLGLAIVYSAGQKSLPPQVRVAVGRMAEPMLDAAVRRVPDDVPAREGRGLALAMQGRGGLALADFQAVLDLAPKREVSLIAAADMAAALRQHGEAERYWRRAIEVNPWTARAHAGLAEALARQGRWADALAECRTALRLNPTRDVRRLLITCLLRTGDRTGAEAEFRTLLADRPAEEQNLRAWWAGQVR